MMHRVKLRNYSYGYTFDRVKPTPADTLKMEALFRKYDGHYGYRTFEDNGKERLTGFVVFPMKMPRRYIQCKLTNFGPIGFDWLNKAGELRCHIDTIWSPEPHPFESVRKNLFCDAIDETTEY